MATSSHLFVIPEMDGVLASAQAESLPAIRNVLLATDFSPASQAALPYACAIARRFGGTLHIVHVVGPEPMIGPLGSPYLDVGRENELARRKLVDFANTASLSTVRHWKTLHRGPVCDVLFRLVDDWDIDLVILGTHGRRGLKYFILGSVAEYIVRHAAFPVMTIGPGVCQQGLFEGRFARILLATNFSSASMNALKYALSMASAEEGRLILLNVVTGEATETDEEYREYVKHATIGAREHLEALVPTTLSIHHETLVRQSMSGESSPAEMIVQSAEETLASLIIMGAHHGAMGAAHRPDATVHSVVRTATCPVMTVGCPSPESQARLC